MPDATPPVPALTGSAARMFVPLTLGILAWIVLRCVVSRELFPYWSGDPLSIPSPVTALTPAWSMAVDCLGLVLSLAGVYVGVRSPSSREARTDRPVRCMMLLAGLGMVPVAYHARSASHDALDNATLGATWAASVSCAFSLALLARDARCRRLMLGTLVGLVPMLFTKAMVQVYIEHPALLENFRATKGVYFESQGWAPDSAAARAYVRRISQPDPGAWFNLSNVLATFAAMGVVLGVGLLFHARRTENRRGNARVLAPLALTLCSALMLWHAGSKGGFTACALGLGLLACGVLSREPLARITHSRPRLAARIPAAIGLAVPVLAFVMILARGGLGERVRELSLYFRWFYVQAGSRIFAQHSGFGVGPAGFKDAYMLAKNPLSPEEVASPHCLPVDWLACLGIAGGAWVALWLCWACRAGVALCRVGHDAPAPHVVPAHAEAGFTAHHDARADTLLVTLTLLLPTALGSMIEAAIATPDATISRVIGCALGVWFAHELMRGVRSAADARSISSVFAAAGLAGAAHCTIEMTGITPGAAAWCFAVLSLSGSVIPRIHTDDGLREQERARVARTLRVGQLALVCFTGASLTLLAVCAGRALEAARWERALAHAHDACEPAQRTLARLRALGSPETIPGYEHDTPEAIARDASDLLGGGTIDPTNAGLGSALRSLRERALTKANAGLGVAAASAPSHFPTHRALSQVRAMLAHALADRGDAAGAAASYDSAEQAITGCVADGQGKANAWYWFGVLLEERARTLQSTDTQAAERYIARAVDAWSRSAALAPHELMAPVRLAKAYASIGDSPSAAAWASKARAINANLRLDPLEQLTQDQQRELDLLVEK